MSVTRRFAVTIILMSMMLLPRFAVAQTEASDFSRIGYAGFLTTTVSDYQCVGINPANLGFVPTTDLYLMASPVGSGIERSKRNWSFTVLEGGISLHSDALDRSGLMQMITQTSEGSFTNEEKFRAATAFADKGVRFSIDVIALGAAYQSESWGGVAITIRERISGTFRFNDEAAQLAFEGRHMAYFDSIGIAWDGDTIGYAKNPQQYSELFEDTRLAMLWFREIGASYGLQLYTDNDGFSIYGGVGVKYLMGYALIDALTENGELKAYSALSPFFGISYGKVTSPSLIAGNDYQSIADGWSFDLGLTAQLEHLTIGVSVVDVGKIFWDGNVFRAKDTILNGVTSDGFSSYNIFEEAPKITGEGNFFQWDGLNSTETTLPSRLRIGSSYQYDTQWRFGFDLIYPVNTEAGALGEPIVSAGVDWRPLVWLRTGLGIGGGGNMGMFMPLSVMFSPLDGMWELGLASRDVVTYFTNDRPILSAVIGVARFRF